MSNPFVPPVTVEDASEEEDEPQQGPSTADKSAGKPANDPEVHRSAEKINWNSITFKDAVGRTFTFPYKIAKSWAGMEEFIKQAVLHVDVIGKHVMEGHHDLIGPDGTILLPQIWEYLIHPGWAIEMRMWPMDKAQPRPIGSSSPVPGMPPGQPPANGIRSGRSGFPPPPPPPPPGWNNGRPWASGYTGPGNGMPLPPGWGGAGRGGPRVINVGPPPQKKKTKQESMLSWMTGKPPQKKSSKKNDYDGSSSHNEPLPGNSVHSPPASPPSTSAPNLGMMPRTAARRSTLANEMITKQPLSRNVAGRSLNLRPKKVHEKLAGPVSAPTSYSWTVTSGSSSVSSKRSVSSIKTVAEEDARRLIRQRRLVVTCGISSRPLGQAMTGLTTPKIVNAPSDVLEMSAAQIYRDRFEKMTVATLELVEQRAIRAPPSQEQRQAGSSTLTWK
ncbi:hypothetical protein GQ607_007022 [Colletotrichum asianum]|uniref:Ubiquitin-like domain-containing protein n=1 Tax=Colletotrichum asianum TaxID=702518 RepID=A0A8H3WFX4_9PEZI|nr:hypothetical protein GQ607_007022 [Colletotrichum asianum]